MTVSALTLPSNRQQTVPGEAHLKFLLDPQMPLVLPMKQVQEVLVLSANRLTPMPNMPACVIGLMNRRSRVLWVVDLTRMLGTPPLDLNTQQHSLVIIRPGNIALGVVVQRVEGMVWLTPDQIQPPPSHVPSSLLTYLRGCVLQEQAIWFVLDALSLLQSPVLHNSPALL
ncbi:chemotaxis protein CheW [Stenomitos frigidus]|uniref:Chemotaxis protein CheW n=1 Tax=Stenomitos frigidus ULC18 TaxID=2107698 RepID=A0A2T1ECD8_9CYAN|nr:chemotaxis protein CheW [Stenomitos frigidus]PSB30417.1 chemotaxis protein CheW [Stenomitos frigidus ULC18]